MDRYFKRFMGSLFCIPICVFFVVTVKGQTPFKPQPYLPDSKINFVRTWEAMVPEQNPATLIEKSYSEVITTTDFTDGFGRLIQTVVKQGSLINGSTPKDVVSANYYDELGRKKYQYLPFVANAEGGNTSITDGNIKFNPFQQQAAFYGNQFPGENFYYTTASFETSPRSRTTNVKLPGNKWNTDVNYKGVSSDYEVNKALENVRIWNISPVTTSLPTSTTGIDGYYPDGKLIKNIVKDDRDKLIVEYNDFAGNVILKKVQEKEVGAGLDLNGHDGWVCTYYVYDDFSRLRYTITPKAVTEMITAGSWVITDAIKKGLCFYNEYDEWGRLIVKSSPDGGEVWMVYDNRDRLILSQDANQRNRLNQSPSKPIQWSFSLYDEFDRPVVSGLWEDPRDRSAMVLLAKSLNQQNVNAQFYTGSSALEQVMVYNPVVASATSTLKITAVNYYDEYKTQARPFEAITSSDFAPSSNSYIEQPVKTHRTLGMSTSSKLLVLNDKFENAIINDEEYLASTTYYDDKGRVLQTLDDNIRQGVDVLSVQYDWSAKALSTNSRHRTASNSFAGGAAANLFNNMITIGKADYDALGRGYKFYKLFTMAPGDISNNSKYKWLSEVSFDEMGRTKTKKIGSKPGSATTPLEIQDFSYNIQGWLTGINKDYALAQYPGNNNYQQFDRFFGIYFGYDNSDNKFIASQYDGNITGTIWRSQGDNTPRKFDYEYDNIRRFKKASFKQIDQFGVNLPTWSNANVDFSSSVDQYDANGNIEKMKQYGIQPGISSPVLIDDLLYTYNASSNKLQNVIDYAMTTNSGKLGDFADYAAGNGIDYGYDYNGNLVFDKNKKIINNTASQTDLNPLAGIRNNFLDLPQTIVIKDKSTTEYIYDAAGSNLAKKVTKFATPGISSTTYFAGSFVYQDDKLQYILHEEGKLRITEPIGLPSNPTASYLVNYYQTAGNVPIVLANNVFGVWDFAIRDNLSNTRMLLTEETHQQNMKCSMETADPNVKTIEEATFGQTGSNNEVSNTRAAKPAGWSQNNSASVSKLISIAGINPPTGVGPNAILKVMAGDNLVTEANYFYQAPTGTPAPNGNIFSTIAASLIEAFMGSTAVTGTIKGGQTATNVNTPGSTNPVTQFLNNQPQVPSTTPKAYLNVMFFDEQFHYVSTGSMAVPVGTIATGNTNIQSSFSYAVLVPKNGYVYIYLSNESSSIPVYFDDFTVAHNRGPILEDNAYYSFGLKIAGISSKAFDAPTNPYLYQRDYSEYDDETQWNEFALRNYDPQLGRFVQVDPYAQFSSAYTGMGNDPVNNIDPTGGISLSGLISNITGSSNVWFNSAALAAGGAFIGGIADLATGGDGRGALIGAGIGASLGLASGINVNGGDGILLNIVRSGENNAANLVVNGQISSIEEETRNRINAGNLVEAILGMMEHYPAELKNKNLTKWTIDDKQAGHVTWPTSGGKSVTSFGANVLMQFSWNFVSFGYLTRTIYHEVGGHVMINSQEIYIHVGWDGEKEVISYTKQYLNKTLPKIEG